MIEERALVTRSTHEGALPPAAYPMVDEAEAVGVVAGIYGLVLERFPMVPSLFKSLAVCPDYLALAWDQTRRILDDERFQASADGLITLVSDAVPPPTEPSERDLLARFTEPLARMLLVTAGLRLALDGGLSGAPAALPPISQPRPLRPDLDVPPTGDLDGHLVGAIRRDLGTPIVNSIWRLAASSGLLTSVWRRLGPHTAEPDFDAHTFQLSGQVEASARGLEWPAVASPAALERRDIGAAAPGVAAILDAYLATLPRVLTLVASSHRGRPR